MGSIFHYETFLLFLGGIFSLILTVIIIFVKQEYKRHLRREELKGQAKVAPDAVGDIEAKLNDSYEYRKLDFFELLTVWGLQPLFIISFINLFYKPNTIEIILAFLLVVFTILHEFWSGVEFSKKIGYQITVLAFWMLLFVLISYRMNGITKATDSAALEEYKKEGGK